MKETGPLVSTSVTIHSNSNQKTSGANDFWAGARGGAGGVAAARWRDEKKEAFFVLFQVFRCLLGLVTYVLAQDSIQLVTVC